MYECLYTNELIKWRSGQLIVLFTVIGFLICFLCLCVCLYICVVCACRSRNEAMCMDALVCVCVCKVVYIKFVRFVFTSGDSSVVSCCFIYYHQRESAGLIL